MRFVKYSSCGNTFLVVDETSAPLARDGERSVLARQLLDGVFGVGGADNVLYVQERPAAGADVNFRIFEHDGSETLSCGNGLLSVAALLHRLDGGNEWSIATELPRPRPNVVHAGVDEASGRSWVDIGPPRPVPRSLYTRAGAAADDADLVRLVVPLPDWDWPAGPLPAAVSLFGYVAFTGEPHFVAVTGHGTPASVARNVFSSGERAAASDALVDHVGRYVNAAYRDLFPQGVHVSFARVRGGAIEYRTYERAIDRETQSCGSGALAAAHVTRDVLGALPPGDVTLLPHLCRRSEPDETLLVAGADEGLVLAGRPRMVYEGALAPPTPNGAPA